MRSRFDLQLQELHLEMVKLGALCETAISAAAKALLEQRVDEAEDLDDVYDENLQYREDFVMDVLYDAAAKALKEDATTTTINLTVKMNYQNEKWWIIADRDLLDAISGGILY